MRQQKQREVFYGWWIVLAAFVGPVFAGYIFDVTNSYRIAFQVFAVLLLLAVAMFMTLGRPSYAGLSRRRTATH